MDAKDYLINVNTICTTYEKIQKCNKECPLFGYQCGIPADLSGICEAIEMIEHYEEIAYPYGICATCGKEFNSELRLEYEIKWCPWCGTVILK